MARKKSPNLTDAELRLMEVLWTLGRATVSEVAKSLPKNVPLAYSTVLTTLRILENKGYLSHVKEGRAYVYTPVVGRHQARENAITHLVRRFFEGSPELLVLNLIDSTKIDKDELRRLRERIGEAKL
jgi:BlaI family transcriptional regulator, penicillinase repressor